MSLLTRLQTRAEQVLSSDLVHLPSPCVSICAIHPNTGLCEGCLRNLDEIASWGQMVNLQQRQVWERIQARCAEKLGGLAS